MRIKIFKGRQYFLFLNALIIKGGGGWGDKARTNYFFKINKTPGRLEALWF